MAARAEKPVHAIDTCTVDGCDEPARYSGLRLCGACYQGIRSNRLRSTKDLMRYARRVKRINARVALITGRVRGKVVRFSR